MLKLLDNVAVIGRCLFNLTGIINANLMLSILYNPNFVPIINFSSISFLISIDFSGFK